METLMTERSPLFRLSILQPCRSQRTTWLVTVKDGDSVDGGFVPADEASLYEEIYSWNPGEVDPLATLDTEDVELFREILLAPFRPEVPLQKRSLAQFRKALLSWDEQIEGGEYDWAPTKQPAATEGEYEDVLLDANILLALRNHLQWVHDIFREIPGASVVIR